MFWLLHPVYDYTCCQVNTTWFLVQYEVCLPVHMFWLLYHVYDYTGSQVNITWFLVQYEVCLPVHMFWLLHPVYDYTSSQVNITWFLVQYEVCLPVHMFWLLYPVYDYTGSQVNITWFLVQYVFLCVRMFFFFMNFLSSSYFQRLKFTMHDIFLCRLYMCKCFVRMLKSRMIKFVNVSKKKKILQITIYSMKGEQTSY